MNSLDERHRALMAQSTDREYQKIGEELVTEIIADRKSIDPDTGELTGSNQYNRRVDYIEVYPQYSYIIKWYAYRYLYFAWYTENKIYISGGTYDDKTSSISPSITPPPNAKYIRFSSRDGTGTMSFKRHS